jgi:hypothetical protein
VVGLLMEVVGSFVQLAACTARLPAPTMHPLPDEIPN